MQTPVMGPRSKSRRLDTAASSAIRTRHWARTFFIGALLGVGCASAGPGSDGREPARPDRISLEELEHVDAVTTWHAISILRPGFFRVRSRTPPAALIDGILQPLATLRDIHRGTVQSVAYLPPAEASLRYGADAAGGLIVVTTRSR